MALKVLVATNMYPTELDTSYGAFVKTQVDALRGAGIQVEVHRVGREAKPISYVEAIGLLRRSVQSLQPDVVFAFYGLTGWVAQWQPKPVVLSLAGDDILGTPKRSGGITMKSRAGIALSQWAARQANVVCVQSEEMRGRLWGARLRDRALVVPYGVDPEQFHPGDQGLARARLGLPVGQPLVLWPNTPETPRKRLDLAELAMAIVCQRLPQARLKVVTRAPQPILADYYRASDCCLLTSDWEGSPNVVKEALVSGLPVVSTDVGDVRHWVRLSPESTVCDRTPEALAAGIERVLRERRRVDPTPFLSAFSSHVVARRMVELFELAVVARRARRT